MTEASRRPLAILAIIALFAGLLLTVATSTLAHASDSPDDAAMSLLNTARNQVGVESLQRNGFIDDFTQAYSAGFAACGGCSEPVVPPLSISAPSHVTIDFAEADGGSTSGIPQRVVTDFLAQDHADAVNPDTYGSIGITKKGSNFYAVLITMSFTTTPPDRIVKGTVTLPKTVVVGTPIAPVIKGFSPVTNYEYTWIAGTATVGNMSTYTPNSTNIGSKIKVIITDSGSGFTTVNVTSATTNAVVAGVIHAPSSVPVSGTRQVGKDLTVGSGGWSPAGVVLTAQWYRNGVKIPGQIFGSYTQTSADRGKKIDVKLTGTLSGYKSVSKATATKTATAYAPLSTTPAPTITGTVEYGQTLTAIPGTWGPAPITLSYQWKANGASISGATKSTHKLSTSDIGKAITVTVTGKKTGWSSVSETSPMTIDVRRLLFANSSITVTGTPLVGSTLKAVPGTWTPAVTTYSYQWLRAGAAISGAKSSSYKLTSKDVGASLAVRVTGTKSGYAPFVRVSSTITVTAP